jgi:hypothetical protein
MEKPANDAAKGQLDLHGIRTAWTSGTQSIFVRIKVSGGPALVVNCNANVTVTLPNFTQRHNKWNAMLKLWRDTIKVSAWCYVVVNPQLGMIVTPGKL